MMDKYRIILLALLLLIASTTVLAQNDSSILDITDKFTGCWNPNEQIVSNADGTITFKAKQWGGLAWWVGGDLSQYEQLVFEFAQTTTCDVQPIIGYEGAPDWERFYTGSGVTEAYIDLNPQYSQSVTQVAIQSAMDATLTIRRIYLLKGESLPIDQPEETKDDDEGGCLMINELMQSNIDCIMDDLQEFPDSWVELYNSGTGAVNLGNYRIGITPDVSEAYQLPGKTLEPKTYAIVYCDKEGDKLHTPFRLESGKGCEVYLFKAGQTIDQVTELPKQPAPNIAYGRETDGSSTWGYQLTPTPNAKNCGQVCNHDHILGEPVFSEKGRVMTGSQNFHLTISVPEGCPEGTEIRYTTNGSEPTIASTLYTSPITINSSCVIRAKLFCDGWLSPVSCVQSYLIHPRNITLPVISIVTDNRYLNDRKLGIFSNNNDRLHNNWRRPINIEFFSEEGEESQINQLCETRVAGAASRGAAKKSMALYAHKRFGTKRFDYEFFPDQKPHLTDYKSIVLRNAGNDFDYLYMRDAIVQRNMASHTDLDWQAWQPAIVYINGSYYSILNIRERANENNVYTNYDGLENIDLFENWNDLKEGDWENLNLFKEFYAQQGHSLNEYEQWMDCYEFLNLMVMNLYYNNYDFPGNNIIMWRPRAKGGRWRWIAKDADYTMGIYGERYNYKILEWLYNPNYDGNHNWGANSSTATQLFRQLMDDKDFKREFIDRAAIYMGDFLNESGTWEVWEPMYEQIKYEYPYHRKLINEWWPNYSDEVRNARNWLRQRTDNFYAQLANKYGLGTPTSLTISQENSSDDTADITFNGIKLSHGVFNGKFFKDRRINIEGKHINGWKVTTIANGSSSTQNIEGPLLSIDMPSCTRLDITAIGGNLSGIRGTMTSGEKSWKETYIYDLNGRKVRSGHTSIEDLPKGVYIINGRKIIK